MNKTITTFLFLLIGIVAKAQQTTLTIDNQTPGWLSSKINYGDQQTVENLTITGYLNAEDMQFIGTLITNQSLNKRLDLTYANIVSNDGDDFLGENAFNINWSLEGNDRIGYLAFPMSLKESYRCMGRYLIADTLVVGGTSMHIIKEYAFSYTDRRSTNYNIKTLILREGTDSIADYAFGKSTASGAQDPKLENISFPSTLKYIGKKAFYNCTQLSNVKLPDSVEEICDQAFYGCAYAPDTLHLPKNLKQFSTCAFNKCKVMYISENVERITNQYYTYSNSTNTHTGCSFIGSNDNIDIHIQSPQPPEWRYNYFKELSGCTIYVPKGSSTAYWDETWFGSGSYNAWSYAKLIIEEIPVESISINGTENLHVGDKVTFNADITPADANNKGVIWESSNADVATINSNGAITALAYGKTTIKATSIDGGFFDIQVVNVFTHTTGIDMEKSISINILDRYKLEATTYPLGESDGKIQWLSSDTDIATVDESGNVKGMNKGSCIITATTVDGGFVAECVVTVIQPVVEIRLEKHETTLNVGASEELRVQILPLNADFKTVTWHSEDENVAIVNSEGIVTAKHSGKVRVYVCSTENNDIMDYCTVTVTQPVTGIILDKNTLKLTEIGETVQLLATILPEDATNKNVRWNSSNEDVCRVSDNGTVVAIGNGTAVIMATTEEGGFLAVCQITVQTIPTGITKTTLDGISIMASNGYISVLNKPQEELVRIYTPLGKLIYTGKEEYIKIGKGMYIVQIGEWRNKVFVW